jgi:hypothetical protein
MLSRAVPGRQKGPLSVVEGGPFVSGAEVGVRSELAPTLLGGSLMG